MGIKVGLTVDYADADATKCGAKTFEQGTALCRRPGAIIDLIQLIGHATNVPVTLHPQFSDLHNLSHLNNQEIDFYSTWMTISENRFRAFDFTVPVIPFYQSYCSATTMRSDDSAAVQKYLLYLVLILTIRRTVAVLKAWTTQWQNWHGHRAPRWRRN